MPLVLSRADLSRDLDQIVPLIYDAFDGQPANGGDLAICFLGKPSPASFNRGKAFFSHAAPEDIWLKIVDTSATTTVKVLGGESGYTGETRTEPRIAAAAYWKFYPTWTGPPADEDDHDMSYLETEAEREDAGKLLMNFFGTRYAQTTMPHALCFIIGTAKAYEGRGCGRMLMNWGLGVADALLLPTWLEATESGRTKLYTKLGFVDGPAIGFKGEALEFRLTGMWREAVSKGWKMETKGVYVKDEQIKGTPLVDV